VDARAHTTARRPCLCAKKRRKGIVRTLPANKIEISGNKCEKNILRSDQKYNLTTKYTASGPPSYREGGGGERERKNPCPILIVIDH